MDDPSMLEWEKNEKRIKSEKDETTTYETAKNDETGIENEKEGSPIETENMLYATTIGEGPFVTGFDWD